MIYRQIFLMAFRNSETILLFLHLSIASYARNISAREVEVNSTLEAEGQTVQRVKWKVFEFKFCTTVVVPPTNY